MDNDQRIAEITARCEAATPEEWVRVDTPDYAEIHVVGANGETPIALVGTMHNADFIAHSREDTPFLLAELDRLTEAQRWIPVSEKPRRTQNCLCLFNDGSMAIAWYNGIPYEFHPDITHWMPLPAAPEEGAEK